MNQSIGIGTSFRPEAEALGIYDSDGKVTESGKTVFTIDRLQGQAVRYMLSDDGSVRLRYEAQIEAGYSEYCLGWCFVFEYKITGEGYELISVGLEEYDY